MLDLSAFTLTSLDWQFYGGLFFLWMMAKFTATELRSFAVGLIAVVVVPSPASLYIVGVLVLVFRVFDFWKAGK